MLWLAELNDKDGLMTMILSARYILCSLVPDYFLLILQELNDSSVYANQFGDVRIKNNLKFLVLAKSAFMILRIQ